jgi:probable addiction module antidote protein
MGITTKPFDAAEHIKTPEDIAAFLEAAAEENDPAFMTEAIGIVARAIGMNEIAKQAGVTVNSLYKSLSENGNPSFSTVMRVLTALNIKVHYEALHEHA